jgi:orotate phosphoribosyltransferase
MSLQDVASHTEGIRTSREEWPFRVAELAKELDAELANPEVLQQVADQLLGLVEKLDCQAVSGASQVGTTLAGAVVARSGNGLRLFSKDVPVESVLVLDGVLATGAQIIRAVNVVRNAGATRAVAAALLADREALALCRQALGDDVLALEEY